MEKAEEEDSILLGTEGFSEEFTSAVGKLTLNFAHLEFMFSLFAGMHMNSGYPFNELVLSELSFRQLINVTVSLYDLFEPTKDEHIRFKDIVKRAVYLEQQRNIITHSFYGIHEKSKTIVRHKNVTRVKSGYKQQRQEINAENILFIAQDIEALGFDLGTLIYEIDKRWYENDPKNKNNKGNT